MDLILVLWLFLCLLALHYVWHCINDRRRIDRGAAFVFLVATLLFEIYYFTP